MTQRAPLKSRSYALQQVLRVAAGAHGCLHNALPRLQQVQVISIQCLLKRIPALIVPAVVLALAACLQGRHPVS